MPAVTNFPRRILQRQTYLVIAMIAAGICLCWLGFRIAGKGFPTPLQFVFACCLVALYILWNSVRHPRPDVRAWIKVRIQWRHRHWVSLFGFPVAIMSFGMLLGLACSVETWFTVPPIVAAKTSLAYAGIAGLLAFFGGFTVYFPSVHGSAVSRRPSLARNR